MDVNYAYYTSAKGFRTVGGTAAQFLKADGSVDTNNYALASHSHTFASLTAKPTTLAGYGVTDAVSYNDTLMPTNSFGGKKLFINSIDNAMFAADKKWDVTVTLHMKIHNSESYPKANPDWVDQYSLSTTDNKTFTITNNVAKPQQVVVYSGTTLCTDVSSNPVGALQFTYNATTGVIVFGAVATSVQVYPEYNTPKELDSPVVQTLNAALPFNGYYENGVIAGSEHYMKVRITPKATSRTAFNQLIGYPYGSLYLSYYYNLTPDKSELRVFNRNFQSHGVGWKKLNFADYIGNNGITANVQVATDEANYGRSIMEVIIYGHNNHNTQLSQIDWKLSRPDLSSTGSTVTKFGVNKLYYDLKFGDADTDKVVISPLGNITAEKFVKTGGTASQFLKADGSIDSNGYVDSTANQTVNGIKSFIGTYSQWVLNNDQVNNARGFLQSLPNLFYVGTLNDKDVVLYRYNAAKVTIGANLVTFANHIAIPNATANNHAVNLGQLASYVTQASLNTQLGNYATLNGVQAFTNTITFDQSPLIPFGTLAFHAVNLAQLEDYIDNYTSVILNSIANAGYATETWCSNNFITLHSPQSVTGQKTFAVPPKVPSAIDSDDAISLGQTEEVAQVRINDTFVEVIYKDSATDLTFNFDNYRNAKVVTITCKGNNFNNIRIENMTKSVNLKIINGSPSLSPIIYFDGGAIATGLGNATWAEFYRDQDGDIFKNNVNGTNII